VLTLAAACILPPLIQAAAASLVNTLPDLAAEVVLILPGGDVAGDVVTDGLGAAVQLVASWLGWFAGEDTLIGRGAAAACALGSHGAWVALGATLVLWGHWVPWAAAGAWAAVAAGGSSTTLPGLLPGGSSSSSSGAGGTKQFHSGLLPGSTINKQQQQPGNGHAAGQQLATQGSGPAGGQQEEEEGSSALDSLDEGGPVGEGRAWVSVGNGQTILLSPSDLAREVPFGVPVPGSLKVLPSPQQPPSSSSRGSGGGGGSSGMGSRPSGGGTRFSSPGGDTGSGSGSDSGDETSSETVGRGSSEATGATQAPLPPRSLGEVVHQMWAKLASWAASNPPLAACLAGELAGMGD
jgi:hypothetical protein